LDIGCADGYFTFLAESRGASVVAIDSWPREGFFLAHEILNSQAQFRHMSVYDLRPDTFGLFDIVFFFGVYYHLKNPLLALERIASVTREYALIESETVTLPGFADQGLSCFFEFAELNNDSTNWWAPNVLCLLQTARASGFPRAVLVDCYNESRAIVRAEKGPRTAGKLLTENFFIAIDTPLPNALVENAMVLISGWALSQHEPEGGIKRILVYLDQLDDPAHLIGEAECRIPRPDLRPSLNPIYGNVGFHLTWDTTGIVPGEHRLYVMAEGEETWNYNLVPITIGVLATQPTSTDSVQTHSTPGAMAQNRVMAELDQMLCERDAEIARLRTLVDGYERGRFIRLMKWLRRQALLRS
jgi:SAM-dependent methyltransferase